MIYVYKIVDLYLAEQNMIEKNRIAYTMHYRPLLDFETETEYFGTVQYSKALSKDEMVRSGLREVKTMDLNKEHCR